MKTYKIVRHYYEDGRKKSVIKRGLTLEEAKAHCRDKETASRTCTSSAGLRRTKKYGTWFDAWTEEQ